ncbi:hypothetical protein [Sphingobacterium sp. 1.A.5]|nr:hypothetical protein [Sphingobacterium sp. 1.A.5]
METRQLSIGEQLYIFYSEIAEQEAYELTKIRYEEYENYFS